MKPTDKPRVTAKASTLEPGQGFRWRGKEYTMPHREQRMFTRGNMIMFRLSRDVEVTEDTQVELILEQKEFRQMEGGQEFYDKHGLLHRRINDDCRYMDESLRDHVNSFCYYDNELWGFDPHSPVFVVKK